MRRALECPHEDGFLDASQHLRDSAEHATAGRHAETAARNIQAVESVARRIDPEAKRAPAPALHTLEGDGLFTRSVLIRALEKLFGHTSEESATRRGTRLGSGATIGTLRSWRVFQNEPGHKPESASAVSIRESSPMWSSPPARVASGGRRNRTLTVGAFPLQDGTTHNARPPAQQVVAACLAARPGVLREGNRQF